MFYPRKSPYECVHSVRIELAKLVLIGTRITYQATGDAGSIAGKKRLELQYIEVSVLCTPNYFACLVGVLRYRSLGYWYNGERVSLISSIETPLVKVFRGHGLDFKRT